jgi:hypothetical protein
LYPKNRDFRVKRRRFLPKKVSLYRNKSRLDPLTHCCHAGVLNQARLEIFAPLKSTGLAGLPAFSSTALHPSWDSATHTQTIKIIASRKKTAPVFGGGQVALVLSVTRA